MTAGKNWIKHIEKAQYSTLQQLLSMLKTENCKPLLLQWTCPNGGMPDQVPVAINMECFNSITDNLKTLTYKLHKEPWQEQTDGGEKAPTSHKSAHVG